MHVINGFKIYIHTLVSTFTLVAAKRKQPAVMYKCAQHGYTPSTGMNSLIEKMIMTADTNFKCLTRSSMFFLVCYWLSLPKIPLLPSIFLLLSIY